MKRKNILNLGRFLPNIYALAQPFFRCQMEFMAMLFVSFHDEMTDRIGYVYRISQSSCSQIFSGLRAIPREAYIFYTNPDEGDRMLRDDVEELLASLIVTNRQKETYIKNIEELVKDSTNLDPVDKQYIINYSIDAEDDEQLNELVFRSLRVLIREPVGKSVK